MPGKKPQKNGPIFGATCCGSVSYACHMAKQKTQLAHLPTYNLRLQPELKQKLEKLAKSVPRSLNAEITERLEQSLAPRRALKDYSDGEMIDELIKRWGRDHVHIRLGKE